MGLLSMTKHTHFLSVPGPSIIINGGYLSWSFDPQVVPSETRSIKVEQRRCTFQRERLCVADPRKQWTFLSSRTLAHVNNNIDDDNNNENMPVDF